MHLTPQQWQSFFFSQALVWGPLVLGHQLRRNGWVRQELSRPLQWINMVLIAPIIYALGIWRLEPGQGNWPHVMWLMTALVGFWTLGGLWLGPRLCKERRARGTLAIMVPLSNTGHTLAGFLTILMYGEAAYAYNAVMMIPFCVFLMLVWIPLGQHLGKGLGSSLRRNYLKVLMSAQILPLIGLGLGFALRATGTPMAPGWGSFLKWTVMISTATTTFALGCRLHLRALPPLAWPLPMVYAAKFVLIPLMGALLCWLTGLRGEGAGALMIASMMPVGVTVVGIATLYELDVDLANAGFLWSTLLFMIAVLPFLIWLVGLPWLR